jgi:hypothetical protein
MRQSRLRRIASGALVTAVAAFGATAAFAASGQAFVVMSVSPSPFTPSSGQTTTITYTVPALCNLDIIVDNSAGTKVCGIVNYLNMPVGTKTRTWNGKDNSGNVLPNGTYTIVVEGKTTAGATITSGSGHVIIGASTTPTPTPTPPPTPTPTPTPSPVSTGTDLGQLVEGCGRANYDWFKLSGSRWDCAFHAVKTGTITSISVPWRTTTDGYGSGTFGVFTLQLQSNGSGNFPSGTVITSVTGIKPSTLMNGNNDYPLTVPISANLVAGTVYHLVFINTDSNYSVNWSSANTVMSRVIAWNPATAPDARGASSSDNGKTWAPWSSNSDIWSSGGNTNNGAHVALVLHWSDGTVTGDPYWSAASSAPISISGSKDAGEVIVWNNATTTIHRIGIPLAGSGAVTYHFEQVGGSTLATGSLGSYSSGSVPQWNYATLSTPVTLTKGQTYRLWFTATSGSLSQDPVYGPSTPSDWYGVSWGGPQSCVITGNGTTWATTPTQDLAFSLQ